MTEPLASGNPAAGRARTISIASPVSIPEEVEGLADLGANELYCGVTPDSWTARYGDAGWLNRRGGGKANMTSVAELARLVDIAHARGLTVSVTLNTPYYTADQMPALVALSSELAAIKVDGIIISDPSLILALREAGSPLPIKVSSVAAVRNCGAGKFFEELGVKRIILPRHLSVADIALLRTRLPNVELEVFALNDGCVYEEGFCATTHAAGAFCMAEWDYDFSRIDGNPVSEEEQALFDQNIRDYREWVWYLANCGASLSARGLPNGPCSLCAIWDFCQMGVDCLKIVGREAHPRRKLRSLELVRAVVQMVEQGASRSDVRAFSRGVRGTPEHCDSGYMCYYREIDARSG